LLAAPAAAGPGELRVCADPNNLPFSNERQEGFENRVAEVLARELGLTLRYTWWAQRRGFVRQTLAAGACDVLLGVPEGFERARLTGPYYASTYVFAWRRADGPAVRSLDDPALRRVRVGVQLIGNDGINTPPAHALARRSIVDNVRGYTVYGEDATPDPPARILRALAEGEIDVALVWGPLAGYFAPRLAVPIDLAPVTPALDPPGLRFVFAIAAGVRKDDIALRDRLDEALRAHRAEIDAILDAYGVPRAAMPARAR
jgi:mxaJ protein